jgi:hypothetical protein
MHDQVAEAEPAVFFACCAVTDNTVRVIEQGQADRAMDLIDERIRAFEFPCGGEICMDVYAHQIIDRQWSCRAGHDRVAEGCEAEPRLQALDASAL